MNNATGTTHSPAWIAQVWISFAIATFAVFAGTFYLDVSVWARAFLAVSVLLCINTSFALAKTLRDIHDGQAMVKRVDEARVEKLITEHDPLRM